MKWVGYERNVLVWQNMYSNKCLEIDIIFEENQWSKFTTVYTLDFFICTIKHEYLNIAIPVKYVKLELWKCMLYLQTRHIYGGNTWIYCDWWNNHGLIYLPKPSWK